MKALSLLVVVLVFVGVGMGKTVPLEAIKEQVYGEIQQYLRENFDVEGGNKCGSYPCCFLENATDGCSLKQMPAEPSTLVFPGGKTRCIFSTSPDFAFQVWPGDSDKLVINFQGGGACWDQPSTNNPLCTTSISPMGAHGVFDRNNKDNKYRKYTIVNILYCSGDVYVGNVTRPYNDKAGVPVQQHGQANVVATYNWILDQQKAGTLKNKFTDLVLMGQSAGSVGVQSWASEILRYLKHDRAAVIPDSYIGVFPPNSQGPFIYDFGACGVGNLPGLDIPNYIIQDCNNQVLTLQEITENQLQSLPNVEFGFIQSKADAVQMSYYTAIAISNGNKQIVLTQGEFYRRANAIMEGYNKYPNFVVYEVDGTQHTFTQMDLYYTASPTGPRTGSNGSDMMHEWVPLSPASKGTKIPTVCEGKVDGGEGEEVGGPTLGPTYCDGNLIPKTYIQD